MQKHIFFTSILLTLLIFSVGVIINYSLDFVRLDEVSSVISDHDLSTQSYLLEQEFLDVFGGNECRMLRKSMAELNLEMQKVGIDMDHYGGKSIFKKGDFEDMRRKFFLLELRYYTLILIYNQKCTEPFIPVLFFYKVDGADSVTQGYILEDITKSHKNDVAILNFDVDFADEPLIELIKFRYNVTSVPLVVVNDIDRFEGLTYAGVINASINRHFRDMQTDIFYDEFDIAFTLRATGVNKSEFIENYRAMLDKNLSEFAMGDVKLVLGRLTENNTLICDSLRHYDNAISSNSEQNAVIFETIAAIGCNRNKGVFYNLAAEEWEKAGSEVRAGLDKMLAEKGISAVSGLNYSITDPADEFAVFSLTVPVNTSGFMIGVSSQRLDKDDIIVSQVDRVTRDWLSYQLADPSLESGEVRGDTDSILTTFSERLIYDDEELRPDIGWHEGARIKELRETGLEHHTAVGTVVLLVNGSWYAMNDKGVFMFEVPIDKVLYPTTRFFSSDLAMIVDTHGVNAIVEQAVRKNASVVVACCDNPSKIQAALYLDRKGISTVCFTDKYLPLAMGSTAKILGSPPIKHIDDIDDDYIILGYRPVEFLTNESFIVMDATTDKFAMSYYKTSKYYFKELSKYVPLNITYVTVTGFNQMDNVVGKAEELGSDVIAARVYNSDDYDNLKEWLEQDKNHRLILFHSMAYPYGHLIMDEFPEQTTFDDIRPIFN